VIRCLRPTRADAKLAANFGSLSRKVLSISSSVRCSSLDSDMIPFSRSSKRRRATVSATRSDLHAAAHPPGETSRLARATVQTPGYPHGTARRRGRTQISTVDDLTQFKAHEPHPEDRSFRWGHSPFEVMQRGMTQRAM